MTSSAEVWLVTIEQSHRIQLDWILDISWCWRDSDLIERICMCFAQHCLNRDLSRWRYDIFLCCSVSFCQTLFILIICIENFSAHQEIVSVVSMLNHEQLMIHRRLALEEKFVQSVCLARCSARRSARFDLWRLTMIQLTVTMKIFECT